MQSIARNPRRSLFMLRTHIRQISVLFFQTSVFFHDANFAAFRFNSINGRDRFEIGSNPIHPVEEVLMWKKVLGIGVVTLALVAVVAAFVTPTNAQATTNLVDTVRQATAGFQDVKAAEAAGYQLFHGCVSGPNEGAMGVHYVNGDLVGDGQIDAQKPEAIMYEDQNGTMRLLGVEYVVIADAWNAKNQMPPVLMGQLFNYASAPNRYGIPAYYYLHVWASKNNPDGTFSDWNPQVSCEDFTGEHSH